MLHQDLKYGFGATVEVPYGQAVALTRNALAREGFGIVSEIDLARTLREKLGVDVPPQVLLGACNPELAHRALQLEPDIGLLLPCTVAVRAAELPTHTTVTALDPVAALGITGRDDLEPLALTVRERLERAITRVADDALATRQLHGAEDPEIC
jgi:uncharacterized protein (DUF302 family)